jgi:hypothetical protein
LRPTQNRDVFEISDLIGSNFIPTCSAVLRNGTIDRFPNWAYSLNLLDWLIFIMAARHGKIKFIDEVMGAYRIHSLGYWSSMVSMRRLITYLDYFENLDPYLDYKYSKQIQSGLNRYWRKMMDLLYEQAVALNSEKAALEFIQYNTASLMSRRSLPRNWKQELFERVYCYFLVGSYESGNYPAAWSAWVGLMKNSPSLLTNRGLALMGLESALNGKFHSVIQRFRRSQETRHDG